MLNNFSWNGVSMIALFLFKYRKKFNFGGLEVQIFETVHTINYFIVSQLLKNVISKDISSSSNPWRNATTTDWIFFNFITLAQFCLIITFQDMIQNDKKTLSKESSIARKLICIYRLLYTLSSIIIDNVNEIPTSYGRKRSLFYSFSPINYLIGIMNEFV